MFLSNSSSYFSTDLKNTKQTQIWWFFIRQIIWFLNVWTVIFFVRHQFLRGRLFMLITLNVSQKWIGERSTNISSQTWKFFRWSSGTRIFSRISINFNLSSSFFVFSFMFPSLTERISMCLWRNVDASFPPFIFYWHWKLSTWRAFISRNDAERKKRTVWTFWKSKKSAWIKKYIENLHLHHILQFFQFLFRS